MLSTVCHCFIVQTFTSTLEHHKVDLLFPWLSIDNTSIALWSTHATLFIILWWQQNMLLFISICTSITLIVHMCFLSLPTYSMNPRSRSALDLHIHLEYPLPCPKSTLEHHPDPSIIPNPEFIAGIKDVSDRIVKMNKHFSSTNCQ